MRCCRYGAGPFVTGVFGDGMGRRCALTSGTLHCLDAQCSMPVSTDPGLRAHTRHLTAAFLASSPASSVNKESPSFARK